MIASLPQVQLGYDDQGSGVPLVFVHGFPHDRSLWAQQRSALSSRARCIVPDLRGFGDSSTHGPFTMDQYTDDLCSLLDWMEIPQAVVCGLSMGGYVAMALWRRHPDRVRGLILCDTKAAADSDAARAGRDALTARVNAQGARAVVDQMLSSMIGASTPARAPQVVASVRAMMERQPVAGIVGALSALRDRPDSAQTIASISVPTLVVVGEEDTITPIAEATTMIDLLPLATDAQLVRIAGAGHLPCLERPGAFNHAIAEFLLQFAAATA